MNCSEAAETNEGAIALRAWLRRKGVSDTTGWRWRKAGWISPINISSKLYITVEDRNRFEERAARGEFAKAPTGAALLATEARKAKESPATI